MVAKVVEQVRMTTADALVYTGLAGQLIVDTGSWALRVQDGVTPGGFLTVLGSNNLSDLSNAAIARGNLGLGSAAVIDADGLLQAANNLSELTNATTARANLIAAESGVNSDITELVGPLTEIVVAFGGYMQGLNTSFGPQTGLLDQLILERGLALTASRNFAFKYQYDADCNINIIASNPGVPATSINIGGPNTRINKSGLLGVVNGVTWAHTMTSGGVAVTPDMVYAKLVCQTANLGYNIGDEIPISGNSPDIAFQITTTDITIIVNAPPGILQQDGTAFTAITAADWKIVIFVAVYGTLP